MAAYKELFIDQGTDYTTYITIVDSNGNTLNVSGWSFSSQLRTSPFTANSSANLVCQIVDAANGNVGLTLTSTNNTINLNAQRYAWDVKGTTPANSKIRIIEGIVIITPSVSR